MNKTLTCPQDLRVREGEFSVKLAVRVRHRSDFLEEQFINVLKEQDAGFLVNEIIRHHGIADRPFVVGSRSSAAWRFRTRSGCTSLSENDKLKKLLAEQMRDNAAFKDVFSRKL